jgi:hypothetical protein
MTNGERLVQRYEIWELEHMYQEEEIKDGHGQGSNIDEYGWINILGQRAAHK